MSAYVVLVIDANDWDREQIRGLVAKSSRPAEVIDLPDVAKARRIDMIVLGLSDAVSLETARSQLESARDRFPHAQLVVCAPRETPELDQKVLALRARAFLFKPVHQETFLALMDESLGQIQLRREREEYVKSTRTPAEAIAVIGESEEIQQVLQMVGKVARSATTSVLLTGESGVGKSLFAETIHNVCETSSGPFIEINCAALPPALLESELFGYEPGAFTDAKGQKIGLIELADNGTLFLDEITEVDLPTQAKLLKFLDSQTFRRLGGEVAIEVKTRVVAATNRDIREEVRQGNFREDLFYRLNVVEISIPPLRDRVGDIDLIIEHFLSRYRKKFNKPGLGLSEQARKLLHAYHWPGNVRELINVIERAVLLCPDEVIEAQHLPIDRRREVRSGKVVLSDAEVAVSLPPEGLPLADVERAVLVETVKLAKGNVVQAAALLGISRGALRNKLERYGIDAKEIHRRARREELLGAK